MAAGNVTVNRTGKNSKKSLIIEKSGDYVETPLTIDGSKPFTISFWGYIENNDSNLTGTVETDARFYFGVAANALFWGVGDVYQNPAATWNIREWTHFLFTGDQRTTKAYINGVYKAEYNYNGKSGTKYFNIGQITGGSFWWNGALADMKLWDRVLTAEEIKNVYSGEEVKNGLTHEWNFKDGTYKDSVGSANGSARGDVYISEIEDKVAKVVRDARTTENDRYIITAVGKQKNAIITSVIEEA